MKYKGRVAVYCDCNSRGGVWAYTVRLLALLKDKGHEALLISHPARCAREEELLATMQRDASQSLLVSREIPPSKSISVISKYLVDKKVEYFIPNYRRISYSAAAFTRKKTRIKIIGVCHNDHESYYSVLIYYQSIISIFICASTKTYKTLWHLLRPPYRPKVRLIPHFVNVPPLKGAKYQSNPFRVIYHGRLQEEQKHCSYMIEVAKRVCDKNGRVEFLLVGDGEDISEYLARIQKYKLKGKVHIKPSLPWNELEELLSQCQLGILTSSYEGFCYGAAEALAMGLPVAAFDCGDVISDFLRDGYNGRVVPWGDVEALSNWILNLVDNEAMWNEYSKNAYTAARDKFSYKIISELYIEALESCEETTEKWPVFRPTFIPEKGKSIRSFVDRKGLQLGFWS
ncbi:glycosyltransferase involved in cell wall biosynthesis [Halospina denitrificans]|uniref:Glycosyltransferase involved in cell wall biosynthesis n=1 Tax=Halospina denitrificans TaxID=332522 RepID=A0A4R7JP24_9GAMM|nr:glycosyltransferase family 4 protein [Halospina denitrificans]TDT39484.1 glycosyltransferase involved in cell wall biosynthesis [Halospina denitrificans]